MSDKTMPFWDHLEELRWSLIRIISSCTALAIVAFCMKDTLFCILLTPARENGISLISTELSSQFMVHLTTSCWIGVIASLPLIFFEVFNFVRPALDVSMRKVGGRLLLSTYTLFVLGTLVCYFILFPVSVRFLGNYSVSNSVHTTITINSYIDTFLSLVLMIGIIFQLPVITYLLARWGFVSGSMMSHYRRHALVALMVLSAIVTPPDVMSLLVVTIPLYLLYESSILVAKYCCRG